MRYASSLLVLGSVVVAVLLGCSSHDDGQTHDADPHSSAFPTCDAIIKACHPVDTGPGKPNDCHVLGHTAATDAECVAQKDECLAVCAAAAVDSGKSDASTDVTTDGVSEGGSDADATADARGD